MQHLDFIRIAIAESRKGMEANEGGPFGAVIVKDGALVSVGHNKVTSTNDPTAHAEIEAIRKASKALDSFDLSGCILYSSCEPCPMCFGAIYWSKISKVFYANTHQDAAAINFDDSFIYAELEKKMDQRLCQFEQIGRSEAIKIFAAWREKADKVTY